MENDSYHKKTLHSKRSFGKHPRLTESPAYDASEEDNDPLTDDGASAVSIHISRPTGPTASSSSLSSSTQPVSISQRLGQGLGLGLQQQSQQFRPTRGAGARHHLAASLSLSDDGVDSPTYDGDIETSTTRLAPHRRDPARDADASLSTDADRSSNSYKTSHLNHSYSDSTDSTASTLSPVSTTSPLPTDIDLSTPSRQSPSSPRAPIDLHLPDLGSISNFNQNGTSYNLPAPPDEPTPPAISRDAFDPAKLTPQHIQHFVKSAIDETDESGRTYKINPPPEGRPVRIYADGVYDLFHFGHALQLRQAKLSFPSVFLIVGVCSDELVREHKSKSVMSHAERVESVRHCRWVDKVLPSAPWILTPAFLAAHEIDYVAHDEEPYKGVGVEDVYGFVKSSGKFLPTRRTPGISTSDLLERIVSGYRKRDWDAKLEKMGHGELIIGAGERGWEVVENEKGGEAAS